MLPILTMKQSSTSIQNHKVFFKKVSEIFQISHLIINNFFKLFCIGKPPSIANAIIKLDKSMQVEKEDLAKCLTIMIRYILHE